MASYSFFPYCFVILLLFSSLCFSRSLNDSHTEGITLDSLRNSLEHQEDVIVFSLIERARFAYNPPVYDPSYLGLKDLSIVDLFIRKTEAIEGKFGRYQNLKELPFFPIPSTLQIVPPHKFPQILYPPAASVNVSKVIWDVYFNELLPMFTSNGDDGNYQQTAAADLNCLQALSRRIHDGRFVAEVKFRDGPLNFTRAIQAKDTQALMSMLTATSVEEDVEKRVFMKAEVFGQTVTLQKESEGKYKVEPSVAYKLYKKWVIPLTKQVEVDYLLRRLD